MGGAHGRRTWQVHMAGAHGRCTWEVHMGGAQLKLEMRQILREENGIRTPSVAASSA